MPSREACSSRQFSRKLGKLTGQRSLDPNNNHLISAIPSSLRRLVNLEWLLLQRNQLTAPLPSQLAGLTQLTNVSLPSSAGFSGCVPRWLRRMLDRQFDWLNLPNCGNDASTTPATPAALEPTYTLTVIAGDGGSIDPLGTTTHTEGVPVTLTASWNDATHTFAGWSGDCSGSDTTCTLEMYANASVTAAFTPLPTDRCASPTDADCIRAVYKGAPDDYAQVQDIPNSVLIQPDDDGRYQVERRQQITVVTAARLPEGYNRFYLRSLPGGRGPGRLRCCKLALPAGTTYTFTVSANERAASSLDFQLHAARAVAVTTAFKVPTPLMLELTSSRETLHRQHPDRAELGDRRRLAALHADDRGSGGQPRCGVSPRQLRADTVRPVHRRPAAGSAKTVHRQRD